MRVFLRYLHADFLKIKRRPVLWIHLLVPLAGIVGFLLYEAIRPETPGSMVEGFLGSVAAAFPTLIALICSMIAEQEAEAGNFQELLTRSSRTLPFLSMTAMTLLLGLGAVLLASFGFEAGFAAFFGETPFKPDFYLRGALLIYASNIFLYLFHFLLSFRFNKGVSVGTGIVESLLSSLLLTGLGDGIWVAIPCAWGLRFLRPFIQFGGMMPPDGEERLGMILCGAETVLIFVFALIWFLRWEGKKTEE